MSNIIEFVEHEHRNLCWLLAIRNLSQRLKEYAFLRKTFIKFSVSSEEKKNGANEKQREKEIKIFFLLINGSKTFSLVHFNFSVTDGLTQIEGCRVVNGSNVRI